MDPNENLDTRDEAHCILDVIQSFSFLAFSIFEWMSSGNLIPSKLFAAKMFVSCGMCQQNECICHIF